MMYDELMSTPEECTRNIISILRGNRVPFIQGSPGIGKSDIVKGVADHYNLKVIDIRLSQVEPTELLGYPFLDGNKCDYKPLKYFPLEGDPVPNGYNGWLLFFDELNSASRDVQAAAYRVLLDREIGNNKLNSNCYVVAAGNLSTDKAIVNKLSSALQSRLIHLFVQPNVDSWLEWAYKNDIDYRIVAFLNQRKDLLWKFDPSSQDVTYPCPRTWHMMSDVIKGIGDLTDLGKVMRGTIGQGTAIEFKTYTELAKDLPTIKEVLTNPASAKLPVNTGGKYYMTALLAVHMDKDNWQSVLTYAHRLSAEFLTVLFKMSLKGAHGAELKKCSGLIQEARSYVAEYL